MFSVVIPLYNAEKTLYRCLNSVLPALDNQDEILLINDGSEDKTAEICQEYVRQKANIRLFSQVNQGPSMARNLGVEQAENPYICFIDGDDEVDTTAFSVFLDVIREENSDTEIWLNDFLMQTPQGKICRKPSGISPSSAPRYGEKELFTYLNERGTYSNVWRCIFRRNFLREKGIYFQADLRCGEDLLFMTEVFTKVEKIAALHLPYYHYIVEQGESLSHNRSLKRVTDFLTAFERSFAIAQGGTSGELLQKKLLRELVMMLPQLPELERAERKAGEYAFLQCVPYLSSSPVKLYRIVYLGIKGMGISNMAKGLCIIKRCKRLSRGLKTGGEIE